MTVRLSQEGPTPEEFVCCQAGDADKAARCLALRSMKIGNVPLRRTDLGDSLGEDIGLHALRLAANCIVDRLAEMGCVEFATEPDELGA